MVELVKRTRKPSVRPRFLGTRAREGDGTTGRLHVAMTFDLLCREVLLGDVHMPRPHPPPGVT